MKFDMELSTVFFHSLSRWFFSQLRFNHFTLDVDSSVWTCYGNQQGAKKGYNPKKRGRRVTEGGLEPYGLWIEKSAEVIVVDRKRADINNRRTHELMKDRMSSCVKIR
jgi:hypothetical protein